MRRLATLVALLIAAATMAQPDEGSLTPEFTGLSAKERARLAKKEQAEAAQDARYQEVMAGAEAHFQAQRYEEALAGYRQARALRPLNVYPKVKIQDLQALLAKREAELRANRPAPAEPVPEPPATAPPTVEPAMPVWEPVHAPPEQPPVPERPEATKPAPVAIRMPEPRPAPEASLPDGFEERTFQEGRAVVLERTITEGGVTTRYRKVTHPWGQVVHFKEGIPISEREWAGSEPRP